MQTDVVVILAALGLALVIVAVVVYRWLSARTDLLDRIRAEVEIKLRKTFTEKQVFQIMEQLDKYSKPNVLQLAIDPYLRYDDPDSSEVSVQAIVVQVPVNM